MQNHGPILLIDDDEKWCSSLKRVLQAKGYQIIEANTGVEGLRALAEKPDLVILDMGLPDMSGYEICNQIKSSKEYASVPVLYLSGQYIRDEDKAQGLEQGADCYLTKPVSSPVLLATICSLLRNRSSEKKLREAIEVRQDLLSVVSHDLRNPLGTIDLILENLRESMKAHEYEESVSQLETIGKVVQRMQSLMNAILDLRKMEAGLFSIESERFDPLPLLKEVIEMHKPLVLEKGLVLEEQIGIKDKDIQGDKNRIFQVFTNLLGNATKFTPEGGKIIVAGQDEGAYLKFSVKDSGPGIPEHEQPLLFDRYWQGKTNHTAKGTGLGLFIARGIVEAHGGKIWLESQVGAGCTFFFTLPVIT